MIYDFNKQLARLEYRAIKIEESSGDPIKDLINTFLVHNSIVEAPMDLTLNQLIEDEGKALISLIGDAHFANEQDSLLFWEALDITLARNYKHHDFAFEYSTTKAY